MTETYEVDIPADEPDHWVSQAQQRRLLNQLGVKTAKWCSGTTLRSPVRRFHTWRISCDKSQLLLLVLKTGANLREKNR